MFVREFCHQSLRETWFICDCSFLKSKTDIKPFIPDLLTQIFQVVQEFCRPERRLHLLSPTMELDGSLLVGLKNQRNKTNTFNTFEKVVIISVVVSQDSPKNRIL